MQEVVREVLLSLGSPWLSGFSVMTIVSFTGSTFFFSGFTLLA